MVSKIYFGKLLVGTLKMCMKVSVNEIGGFNFGEW